MPKPNDTEESAPDDPAMVSVTIAVDNHVHAGIAIPRGAVIDVDKQTASWMLQHHLIEG
jgi:hypothetical protein